MGYGETHKQAEEQTLPDASHPDCTETETNLLSAYQVLN